MATSKSGNHPQIGPATTFEADPFRCACSRRIIGKILGGDSQPTFASACKGRGPRKLVLGLSVTSLPLDNGAHRRPSSSWGSCSFAINPDRATSGSGGSLGATRFAPIWKDRLRSANRIHNLHPTRPACRNCSHGRGSSLQVFCHHETRTARSSYSNRLRLLPSGVPRPS